MTNRPEAERMTRFAPASGTGTGRESLRELRRSNAPSETSTLYQSPAGRIAGLVVATLIAFATVPLGAQPAAQPVQPVQSAQRAEMPDSLLDAQTRSVASQIRCPVCQGLSIQDSPSPLAQQMRDHVRQMLRAGKNAGDVKRYFVARYGVWVLMEPPAAGFDWLVYVLPVLALAGGTVAMIVAVRRWTAGEDHAPPATEDTE